MMGKTTARPYSIWIIVALNFVVSSKLIFSGQFSPAVTFSILSGLLLFIPNKLSWTISMSWAFMAIILLGIQLGFLSGTMPSDVVLPVLQLLNLLLQVILTAIYFKPPYIQSRWSPLGTGMRVDVDLEGELIGGDDVRTPVSVVNISNSGVAIRSSSVKGSLGSSYVLSIPKINGFRMSSKMIRQAEDVVALQFNDLNPRSVFEHLKLLRWIKAQRSTSQSGFSLVEAMIVCAVGTIAVLAASELMTFLTKANQTSKILSQVQFMRDEIVRDMRNSKAWENTISDTDNTVLDCLRTNTQCTTTGFINLRDSSNSVSVPSIAASTGFTPDGAVCTQFDAVNGNASCPLKFTITASPICAAGACENPTISLTLNVLYKPSSQNSSLNLGKLRTVVYHDPLVDSLQKSCLSLNGTFNAGSGTCELTLMSAACNTQSQYLAGVDEHGAPVCRDFPVVHSCPSGQFLQGFNGSGDAICAAL